MQYAAKYLTSWRVICFDCRYPVASVGVIQYTIIIEYVKYSYYNIIIKFNNKLFVMFKSLEFL